MKPSIRQFLVFAFSGVLMPTFAAAEKAAESRSALIIGVGKYDDTYFSPLKSPKLDAEKMERQLKALGFEVETLKDTKRRAIVEAIDHFGEKLAKRGGIGLFYYSGHGVQFEQQNFMVPTGTDIKSTRDLPEEAVAVQRVLNRMTEARNRLNLVFLDACRNNAIPSEAKSSGNGLASMRGGSGLMVFFATQPGQVAFDSTEGSGSLFTTALLNHLQTPGVSLMDMMADVTAETETLSEKISDRRERQTPFVSGSLSGRFYFVPEGSASTSVHGDPATTGAKVENAPPDSNAAKSGTATDIFSVAPKAPYLAYNAYTKEIILRRVQAKLNATGFYLGAIDGKSGPLFTKALTDYQRTLNLPDNGWLDEATLQALKLDGIAEMQPPASDTTSEPVHHASPPRTTQRQARSTPKEPAATPAPPPPVVPTESLDEKFRRAAAQFENKK